MRWNEQFPIDYFWRKKYNIPFGSQEHKAANFILMALDLKEDKMFKEYLEKKERIESGEDEIFKTQNKNVVKMTQSDIDDEFDNLDINQFNA